MKSREFDQVWKGDAQGGEAGDVERTLLGLRALLAVDSLGRVTLRVGTRSFGEKVLGQLNETELVRVVVLLSEREELRKR